MHCKNCNTELPQSVNYCYSCGGRVIRNKLTLKNLIASFSVQFFNYDNKFLQTFIALFKKPEDVIDGYINGLRKRYVNPISYFAIAVTLTGLFMFITLKYFPEAMDMSSMTQEGMEEFNNSWFNFFTEYQSLVFFANVPIYAFLGWVTFLTLKRYNFVSHVVFFLYTVPQMSFALFIPQLILMFFGFALVEWSFVILGLQMIYVGYVYQKIFKLTPQGFTLRCLLLLGLLVFFMILIMIIGVVYAIMSGEVEKMIEAQKAAKETTFFLRHFFLEELYFV